MDKIMNKMGIVVVKWNASIYNYLNDYIDHYTFSDGNLLFSRNINGKEYGIDIIKRFDK